VNNSTSTKKKTMAGAPFRLFPVGFVFMVICEGGGQVRGDEHGLFFYCWFGIATFFLGVFPPPFENKHGPAEFNKAGFLLFLLPVVGTATKKNTRKRPAFCPSVRRNRECFLYAQARPDDATKKNFTHLLFFS